MNLFVFSMTLLVLIKNVFLFLIAWELTSVCSWGLIGLITTKKEAKRAAFTALLTTSFSDIFLFFGVLSLIKNPLLLFETTFEDISNWYKTRHLPILTQVFLWIGVLGKSAQIPLYFWLPEAMVAPATVSALLHSATMVKAGVYLSLRLSFYLGEKASFFSFLLEFTGAFTFLYGSFLALFSKKVKRLLAYSTISNIGLMLSSLFFSPYSSIMFFLFHSFCKASLFLFASLVLELSAELNFPERLFLYLSTLSLGGIIPLPGAFPKIFCLTALRRSLPVYVFSLLGSFFSILYSLKYLSLLANSHKKENIPYIPSSVPCILAFFSNILPFLVLQKESPPLTVESLIEDAFLIASGIILFYFLKKKEEIIERTIGGFYLKTKAKILNLSSKIITFSYMISQALLKMDKRRPRENFLLIVLSLILGGIILWIFYM